MPEVITLTQEELIHLIWLIEEKYGDDYNSQFFPPYVAILQSKLLCLAGQFVKVK